MVRPYTRELIKESFIEMLNERPLADITIKDLAVACDINRNTFYYYFVDIYEVLEEIFKAELEKVLEEYNDTLSWEESFIAATRFATENKRAIYHVYNSMRREDVINYIYHTAGEVMRRYVESSSKHIPASEEDKAFIASFYQCALTEMVSRWVSSGMKEDPDYVVRRIGLLFDGNIEISLQRSGELNK